MLGTKTLGLLVPARPALSVVIGLLGPLASQDGVGPPQDQGAEKLTESGAPTAFEHVNVVTMERDPEGRGRVLEDQTVLVRDGRIEALGPTAAVSVPADAVLLDGRGRFLMPGLADMHVHCWNEGDLFLFVANGVTTIRNMFGSQAQLEWRRSIEAGELVGPRIYTAGPIIDGSPPVWPGSSVLNVPERAAEVVREQREAGYDFLKPYAKLSAECYEALAIAAEEQGMLLMGHVPEALDLHAVVEAGQRSVEHLDGWAEAAQRSPGGTRSDVSFEGWENVDPDRLVALAEEMRERGAWNCPTLIVRQKWVKGAALEALLARPEMRYVSPWVKNYWSSMYVAQLPDDYLAQIQQMLSRPALAAEPPGPISQAIRALRDAGSGILLGTDMGNPYVLAGFAVHEELENLGPCSLRRWPRAPSPASLP